MKKRKLLLIVTGVSLVLLMTLFAGCATVVVPEQTAQPSGFVTYTDTTNGFSISYPKDWERVPQNLLQAGESVAFWAFKQGNGMPPYCSVTAGDAPSGMSLEAYFEQGKPIAEANPGYSFISKDSVVINGIPAIKHIFAFAHEKTPANVMQLTLVHGDSSWFVTCMCSPELYSKHEPTFDAIINSFRLLKAAAPTPPTTSSGFLTHTDQTNGFSISYPEGWERVPQEFILGDIIIGFRTLGTTSATLLVYKTLLASEGNLQTAYEEMKQVHAAEPGYRFISKDDITVDSIQAFKYIFQKSYDGVPATLVYVYLVQGRVARLVSLACIPAQSYTQYQPTFDAIISSFHISGTAATVPPPASPTPTTSPGLLTHADRANGFSVAYPEGWEMMPKEMVGEGLMVGFWPQQPRPDARFFTVGKVEWPSSMNVEDFYRISKPELEKTDGYSFISKDNLTINGIPAISHTFTFKVEAQTLKSMQILLVEDGTAWFMSFAAPPAAFNTLETTFTAIASSLQTMD